MADRALARARRTANRKNAAEIKRLQEDADRVDAEIATYEELKQIYALYDSETMTKERMWGVLSRIPDPIDRFYHAVFATSLQGRYQGRWEAMLPHKEHQL